MPLPPGWHSSVGPGVVSGHWAAWVLAGNFAFPGEEGRRLTRCVLYQRDFKTDNGYAHPIDGLDRYQEMMRLLEEKQALKVFVNVS